MFESIFHYVGGFIKYVGAAVVLVFSVSLSYTFFSQIAPPNMPWFVWAALGLTEIGLLVWIAAFRMQKHHDGHKAIAFIMVIVCLIAVGYTDAMELAVMFHVATVFATMYYYALIVLLLIHFGAFVLDEFIKESEKFNRKSGNLIPTNSHYATQYQVMEDSGETDAPLLTRPKRAQPKQDTETMEAMNLSQTASIPAAARGGASLLIGRAKNSMKSGLQAGRVRGKANGTTSDTTSIDVPMDDPLDA